MKGARVPGKYGMGPAVIVAANCVCNEVMRFIARPRRFSVVVRAVDTSALS